MYVHVAYTVYMHVLYLTHIIFDMDASLKKRIISRSLEIYTTSKLQSAGDNTSIRQYTWCVKGLKPTPSDIGINPRGWSRDPKYWDGVVSAGYNVQEHEMKTLPNVVT